MENQIKQSVFAGFAGTAVMTMVMFIAPFMGMPKMNPAAMLAEMLSLPMALGWIMHFMTGIVFAAAYVYILRSRLQKMQSRLLRGAAFGFAVFAFAQIMMLMMKALLPAVPVQEGSMILVLMGSIIGHMAYGIVVALMIKD
ncbi:MAG: DUF6789 family protein [Pedobacter sp.]|jgi:uncharacterized membrane protein YagU involved in acid resistance